MLYAKDVDLAEMARVRGRIARKLARLEDYEAQWAQIIADLPEQSRPAEEMNFMDFEEEHDLRYYMELARKIMEQIDEELEAENPSEENHLPLGGPATEEDGGQSEPVQNGVQPGPVRSERDELVARLQERIAHNLTAAVPAIASLIAEAMADLMDSVRELANVNNQTSISAMLADTAEDLAGTSAAQSPAEMTYHSGSEVSAPMYRHREERKRRRRGKEEEKGRDGK